MPMLLIRYPKWYIMVLFGSKNGVARAWGSERLALVFKKVALTLSIRYWSSCLRINQRGRVLAEIRRH
jgi:hypothetical protein